MNDFTIMDPVTGAESERPKEQEYVVLFKSAGSPNFVPIFHSQRLNGAPRICDTKKGVVPQDPRANKVDGLPIWESDAGAIDYIREHRQASLGEYRIKDRKGNIVP